MPRSRIHRFAHQHKPHPVEISWNSRVSCRDEIPGKFACIFLKRFCIVWENIKSFRFDTIPRHGQAMFMDNAFRQLTVSLLVFTNTFSWKGRKNSEIPEAKRFFELAKVSIFAFRFYAHVRFYRMPIPPHWKYIFPDATDVARILVLSREGGVALDLDTFVVKPLRSFYYSGTGPVVNDCVLGWPEGQFIGTQVGSIGNAGPVLSKSSTTKYFL